MTLTSAQRWRLGLFVSFGALLLIGALVGVIGRRLWSEVWLFQVRYRESVAGLDVGSPVRYQGLRVGRVAALRIATDDASEIEVDLALEPGTLLYQGTMARLDQAGLTGLTYINLTPGEIRGKPLPPGSRLFAGTSLTARITGEAEAIGVKLEHALELGTRMLGDSNRQRVERLLDDADILVRDLDASVLALQPRAEQAIASVEAVAQRADGAVRGATQTLRHVDETLIASQRVLGEAERVLQAIDGDNLRATMVSARSAAARLDARVSEAELGRAIAGIHDALANVRGALRGTTAVVDAAGLTVRALREDVVGSLRHMRETSENLRTLSRDVARDPSLLLRGRSEGEP